MATKVSVILETRSKDRGVARSLQKVTTLAEAFGDALERAQRAGSGLGPMSMPAMAGGIGMGDTGRRSSGRRRRSEGVDPVERARQRAEKEAADATKQRARRAKEYDRALKASLRDARAEGRALNREAKIRERLARQTENMSREQLVAVELQQEINRRRRREARTAAQQQLGPVPSPDGGGRRGRGRGGRDAVSFGADLAIAGAEFEQFGARVGDGIRSSFDAFKDYEKGVAEVSTLTKDISVEQIRQFTSEAAAQFGGLPTDQVTAFYQIVSAGATDAASAQEQLVAANKLAIGGVATQEEAVLAISKSVANFKSQGVDATRASDILFASVQRGQTTVSELARAIPAVANQAATAGLTMEDTAAAVAVLSTKLPSASEGAIGLNQALTNIMRPSKMAREEAKRLGIDFSAAGIEAAGGFEEWLLKLGAADKLSEQSLGKLFESSQARRAIGGLLADMEGFNSVLGDTTDSSGKAEEAYGAMAETAAQKSARLEAQWELLKIQSGEALLPALTQLSERIGPIIKDVTEWIKANPELAGTLAKVAIGAAITGRVLGGVTSAISMISSVVGLSQSGLDMFTGKLGVAGKTATGTAGRLGKLGAAFGGLAGPIAVGATGAIVAFEVVLARAGKSLDKELARLDMLNRATGEGGLGISFQDETGREKSEEELLMERRNRLIEDVNAKREAAARGGTGAEVEGVAAQALAGAAGIFNEAFGVADDLRNLRTQAELDLARFDRQFGEQLGLTADQRFTTEQPGGVSPFAELAELVRKQTEATERVAQNTSGRQPWQGPSMEAGLT